MLTNFKALISSFVSIDKSKVLSTNILTFSSAISCKKVFCNWFKRMEVIDIFTPLPVPLKVA